MRTKACSRKELDLLLDRLCGDNRFAVEVAAESGLRIDDVLSLPWLACVEPVEVVEAKRGVHRIIDLSPDLRRRLKKRGFVSAWLFPGRVRGHRHRSTVFRAMDKACKAAGLQRFSPHSLRKFYARQRFDALGDVELVRRELGHKYVSTTLIYLFM
ncbi:MAG: tyrosine-type recombinase/integrase [Clostridia bacterium]|nr:tyrosine-type recombinase/integrase [Clostridia bacterium]